MEGVPIEVNTPLPDLITVVVPTCHRNDLLAKCLDCLAPSTQTLNADHYEVIVTDDGSNSTAEQMIATKYPWVRWTQGPRRGPAANRNHGASLARGAWIAFTDDDCLPDPEWLLAFAEARSADRRVYEGRTTCAGGLPSPMFASPINESGGLLWSCNFMVERELFERLGGFDESYPFAAMEDVDLRERIIELGNALQFVPKARVEHPPRRVPSGKRRGQMTASEFLFFTRKGMRYGKWPLLRQRAYVRLREVAKLRKGWDSFLSVGHLTAELFTIWRLFPEWEKQWPESSCLAEQIEPAREG